MNLIDATMIDNEKERLIEFVGKNKNEYAFPIIDHGIDSYYINYSSGKHLDKILTEYNADNLNSLKSMLHDLWKEDECCIQAVPIIMTAYMKLSNNSNSAVKEMDMYNYMM